MSRQVECELTVLMPCLNEAETLAVCIRKANKFLIDNAINGQVLIADNGSTDGSQDIAKAEGADVVNVPQKGYGAALIGGIDAAAGQYIIMGDADDSYDFTALMPFVEKLRSGADLVMGNRFLGGISPGAMPFLHKYLGNPVLSAIGRLFFDIDAGDLHSGLRGFNKERNKALNLRTTGMEFASEMVVRSALSGYEIAEAPTTLRPDGRSRPAHLRTWRDGWRHLIFLLMFSPKWLFLYPGIALLSFGVLTTAILFPGAVSISGVQFDIHTYVIACFSILLGVQAISFAAIVRRFATSQQIIPPSPRYSKLLDAISLEHILIVATISMVAGAGGLLWSVLKWNATGFGALDYSTILRTLVLSVAMIATGIQMAFSAFLASIMEIPTQ